MEIKWFNCFGESGRLQTQQIRYLNSNIVIRFNFNVIVIDYKVEQKDNDAKAYQIASQINTLIDKELIIYQPFEITISYKNISNTSLSSMWILKEGQFFYEN